MPIAQAKPSARWPFCEKYPDIVRVVRMGEFSRTLRRHPPRSHRQVGLFKIIGEESVSAGTRRIAALVGKGVLEYVREEEEILANLSSELEGARETQFGEQL